MKILFIALGLVIFLLSVRLLSSDGGVGEYLSLSSRLDGISEEVAAQRAKNQLLRQEVEDLQSGSEAIETIARRKLGMIGENEVFVRVIEVPEIPQAMSLPVVEPSLPVLDESEPEGTGPAE